MKSCWNCQEDLQDADARCWRCGAAVAVIVPESSDQAAAPARRDPRGSRRAAPVRNREQFHVAQHASIAEPARAPVRSFAARLAPPLRSMALVIRALQRDAQATSVLLACTAILAYTSVESCRKTVLGVVDCSSMGEAQSRGMLHRQAVPSPAVVEWSGRRIAIHEGWIGELGEYRYASPFTRNVVLRPSGRYRLYFSTPYTGWPETPQFYAGSPPRRVEAVVPDSKSPRTVLHFIEVSAYGSTPLTVTVRDALKPEAGVATFTLY